MMNERVRSLLDSRQAQYRTLSHREAYTAQEIAAASHVPGDRVAKVVVVRDAEARHLMVVLPAPCRLDLEALARATGRQALVLAGEEEVKRLFPDCETGAMPPFGSLYELPVYVDACFPLKGDIFFQAGNHRELIEMRYREYERIASPFVGEYCVHAHVGAAV